MSFDEVKSALEASAAAVIEGPQVVSRAAVSAVLRPGQSGLEVLLIRRAKRDGDPWSGHMAFPGGRSEDHDRDLLETAVRETREEIGLDLRERAQVLGRLDDIVPGSAQGLLPTFVVTPFVWGIREVPRLVPNGIEVDEIHWAPLAPLMAGQRQAMHPYTWRGQPMQFPGYEVGDAERSRVVWGMTHRLLETLFARLQGRR